MALHQHQHSSLSRPSGDINIWKHGQLPMPDWLPQHMAGGIAKNGALKLKTELGQVRAQSGDVVIEKHGTVWVRTLEEAPAFVKDLERDAAPAITNIGPGKARRFGTTGRINGAAKRRPSSNAEGRRPRCSPLRGALPSIEWVHLQRLSIDCSYQRSTDSHSSRRLIASIMTNFDWRLCGPLVVSRRPDDTLVIIDGQHRWLAASRRGDIPQLPCCIFRYDSPEEEARMFIAANRARKPINRLEDFYAALAAADEDAQEIRQLVIDAGLKVARSQATQNAHVGEVAFVASIARAIRTFGAEIASAALTDMGVAFRGQKLHGGAIFGALIKILSARNPDLDPDRLVSALQTKTAEQWEVLIFAFVVLIDNYRYPGCLRKVLKYLVHFCDDADDIRAPLTPAELAEKYDRVDNHGPYMDDRELSTRLGDIAVGLIARDPRAEFAVDCPCPATKSGAELHHAHGWIDADRLGQLQDVLRAARLGVSLAPGQLCDP